MEQTQTQNPLAASQFNQPEPEQSNTPGRIAWLASQARHLAAEAKATADIYQAEIDRLQAELAEINDIAANKIEYYTSELLSYHRAAVADGKPKTLKLPAGVVKATKTQTKLVIADESELIQFAVDTGRDELITVKASLAETKKLFKDAIELAGKIADSQGFDRARSLEPMIVTGEMVKEAGGLCPEWLTFEINPDKVSFKPAD